MSTFTDTDGNVRVLSDEKRAQLAQAKYLKQPHLCPLCGDDHIEAQPGVELEEKFDLPMEAWQEVKCYACGGWWRDIYTLSGFQVFTGLDA